MRGEEHECSTLDGFGDFCNDGGDLVDERRIIELPKVGRQTHQGLGKVVEGRRQHHFVRAQCLEPDPAFEVRERLGDGERRGGKDHRLFIGEGAGLQLTTRGGRRGLDHRPAAAAFAANPVQPVHVRLRQGFDDQVDASL